MSLHKHPYHEHALIRRQLSENCLLRCTMCRQKIQGPTVAYCCPEDCKFFVDEVCALIDIPPIIYHPCHPQHPVSLRPFPQSCYFCGECNYSLDILFAIATLPPQNGAEEREKKDEIQHFAHEHPLTFFLVRTPYWISCRICGLTISGPVYFCRLCSFMLHQRCVLLPQEILQHPFHQQHRALTLVDKSSFRCSACDLYPSNVYAYQCSDCQFSLDVLCAILVLPANLEGKPGSSIIEHFSHPHQLQLHSYIVINDEMKKITNINCKICEVKISGEVYYCPDCIFFVHKSCQEDLPREIIAHYLHPEHPLTLLLEPEYYGSTYYCDCCSKGYQGINFNCKRCEFDLDPVCALQTLSAVKEGLASKIQHFAHVHTLTLQYIKRTKERGDNCKACRQPVEGLVYGCLTCKVFVLHKLCAQLPMKLEHMFHPSHPLVLLPKASADYFYCNACHQRSEGFTFYCAECEFYLDTGCATLKPTLKHPRHEHSLAYVQAGMTKSSQCDSCGKGSMVDLYSCVLCDFNLHHECLPLPSTIVNNHCHFHPLSLSDRYIDGNPQYQYCDHCETMRNPDRGVYICEQCFFAAHIECAISAAKPEGKLEPSEDPVLNKLDKEITILKAKTEVMEKILKVLREKLRVLEIERETEFLEE